jgi:hypothetical protein
MNISHEFSRRIAKFICLGLVPLGFLSPAGVAFAEPPVHRFE